MIIANPIYDVVFKRMMENERVVRFFIGTLINEEVESVVVNPQEYTFMKYLDKDDPDTQEYIYEKLQERLFINVFRLDFIATIKTKSGEYKKILVEIQKAWSEMDLMRFRNYLGEHYKKVDNIDGNKTALPITTIYILGFKLPEIDTACLKVQRDYIDLINGRIIEKKNEFVEKLTHDCYIVQVGRIKDRYQSRLEQLLSVFEQANFERDTKTTKNYTHQTDIEEMKLLTDILHHVGTDPMERIEIEKEEEAWRTIDALFYSKEKKYKDEIQKRDKIIQGKDLILSEKDKALSEKDKIISDNARIIDELMRKLGQK
jgi:hypothetical protein